MGAVRLREDARLPLGNFPATARPETRSEFRNSQRASGLARGARRVSLDFASRDRYGRRHRTCFSGTAAHAGGLLSIDLRSPKHFSSERRRGAAPLGPGMLSAVVFRKP